MITSRFQAENYHIPKERIEAYNNHQFKSINNLFFYVLLGLLCVGVGLAFLYDTWGIALGAPIVTGTFYFILLKWGDLNRNMQNYLLATTLFAFQVQFTFELPQIVHVQLIYFSLLTLLTLFRNWQLLLYYFSLTHVFYFLLSLFSTDFWGSEMLETSATIKFLGVSIDLFTLSIISLNHLAFCIILSRFLHKFFDDHTRKILFIEDQANLEQNEQIAKDMVNEDLDKIYDIKENDMIGNMLVNLRDHLKDIKQKEDQQHWITVGNSSISELLLSTHKLERLCNKVTREISVYVNAVNATLYLLDDDSEGLLSIQSCYAGSKRHYTEQTIAVGEGQVGEVARTGKNKLITDIPEDYEYLASGLGESRPVNIFILPIKSKATILGVIEVSTFHEITPHEKIFIEGVVENLGLTVESSKSAQKTKELLKETQLYNKMMKEKEEQLRENVNKLSLAQKEMKKRQRLLEERENESKQFFNNAMDAMISFGEKGNIQRINPAAEIIFKISKEEALKLEVTDLIGKGYHRAMNKRIRMKLRRHTQEIFDALVFIYELEIDDNIMFIVYIQDISEQVKKEKDMRKMLDKTQMKNEDLRIKEKEIMEKMKGLEENKRMLEETQDKLQTLENENTRLKKKLS